MYNFGFGWLLGVICKEEVVAGIVFVLSFFIEAASAKTLFLGHYYSAPWGNVALVSLPVSRSCTTTDRMIMEPSSSCDRALWTNGTTSFMSAEESASTVIVIGLGLVISMVSMNVFQ